MDLRDFSLPDLLETAIKSEIEAREMYLSLRDSVKDSYLRNRLEFIAGEEATHRDYLTGVYRNNFNKDPVIPESSVIPLPEVKVQPGLVMASDVLDQAMVAEKAASDFYLALSEMFQKDHETENMLSYLSKMETGHYNLLQTERDRLMIAEDYEFEWPMMHAGP
jgi:rubrerythrin